MSANEPQAVHIRRVVLSGVNKSDPVWSLEGTNGHIVDGPEIIYQSGDFALFPLICIFNYPRVKIEIPKEFKQRKAVQGYQEYKKKFKTNAKISQAVRTDIRAANPDEVEDIFNNWKKIYSMVCQVLSDPDVSAPKKDFIIAPEYSFLRLTSLRQAPPQASWMEDPGDASKLVYQGIPGQTTMITKELDESGIPKLVHLTKEQKFLIHVLWDWYFQTGKPEVCQIPMSKLCTLLGKPVSGRIYEIIWDQLKKIKMQTVERKLGTDRIVFNFLGNFTLNEKEWILSYTLGKILKDGKAIEFPIRVDISQIAGLNTYQDNIISFLMSHAPIKVDKYKGLLYHHYYCKDVEAFASERGYISDSRRGNRPLQRFFSDLEDLKKKRPANPVNSKMPGFDYYTEESLFGLIYHFVLANTRV